MRHLMTYDTKASVLANLYVLVLSLVLYYDIIESTEVVVFDFVIHQVRK